MEDEAAMTMAVTTRAAEGLPRRAFTVREVERMQRQGILHPDEKIELVEGEIVPMQAKSPVHELIKGTLIREIVPALPDELWLGCETTIYLSDRTALDPDLSIFPAALRARRLAGTDMILVIEVAVSSLGFDRGLKASLYARFGVPEVWVIDAARRTTRAHRGPQREGAWNSIVEWGPDHLLAHPSIPGWSTRLSDV